MQVGGCHHESQRSPQREQRQDRGRVVVPRGVPWPQHQACKAGERCRRQGCQQREQGVEDEGQVATAPGAAQRHQHGQRGDAEVHAQADRHVALAAQQLTLLGHQHRHRGRVGVADPQQVDDRRIGLGPQLQQRLAVWQRPFGHGQGVAGVLLRPAAVVGLDEQGGAVQVGVGDFEVPVPMGRPDGRGAKANPHHVGQGVQGKDVVRPRGLPGRVGQAHYLVGGGASRVVDPVLSIGAQAARLLGVRVQRQQRLCLGHRPAQQQPQQRDGPGQPGPGSKAVDERGTGHGAGQAAC